jgi:hypothetical protein
MLVLSGSHRAEQLFSATPGERPTYVGEDLRALLRPPLDLSQSDGRFRCGAATASAAEGTLIIHRNGSTEIEAIWATAHAAWWGADHGLVFDVRDALAQLSR